MIDKKRYKLILCISFLFGLFSFGVKEFIDMRENEIQPQHESQTSSAEPESEANKTFRAEESENIKSGSGYLGVPITRRDLKNDSARIHQTDSNPTEQHITFEIHATDKDFFVWKDGKVSFVGDFDQSAKILFEKHIAPMIVMCVRENEIESWRERKTSPTYEECVKTNGHCFTYNKSTDGIDGECRHCGKKEKFRFTR